MGTINIIIVEDNIALRQSLEEFLSSEGMLVRGVESGEELDKEIIKAPPDALIMDLNLPGEDGIDIIPRVKKAYPDMGVVVLTARVRTQDRKEAYAAGADVFLSKPAGADELSNVIHSLVRRAKSASGSGAWVLERLGHKITPPHPEPISLTPSECLLLHALALSPDLLPFHRLLADFGDPAAHDAHETDLGPRRDLRRDHGHLEADLGDHAPHDLPETDLEADLGPSRSWLA